MKVIIQVLATTVLAGMALAQSTPASQTVRPNVPQAKVQSGASSLQSPFAPKSAHKTAAKAAENKHVTKVSPKAAENTVAKASPKATENKHVAKVSPKPAEKNHVAKATLKQQVHAPAAPVHMAQKAKTSKVAHARVAKTTKPAAPVVTPAAAPVAPAAVASSAIKLPDPGKRDPFLSPIAAAALNHGASGCTTGKRCLSVAELVLKGIVQMKGGNFAVVENPARHMYELRENDSLLDGSVVRITGDSVVFRENSSDILGRPVSKEVVKKVSAPAV
ncbi:MAG TPA: hypothetical protein VFQ00_07470 [Terriglobales bacterium]|nr:hypothetical protein [Terriglobales bacterium]